MKDSNTQQIPAGPEKSMTTHQAGELLGCTHRQVRVLINSGKLDAFRIGRHYRVTPSAVAKLQRGE